MQKKRITSSDKYRFGFIVSLFISLFSNIKRLVHNSFFVGLLTDYQSIKSYADNSKTAGIISFFTKIKHKTLGFRTGCARLAEQSVLMNILDNSGSIFFRTSLRSVGVFLLSGGAVIVLSCLTQRTASIASLEFSDTFILGALMMLGAVFFLPQKNKSISGCIRESRILSYFFVDILYLKHIERADGNEVRKASAYSFILGVSFGAVSYGVSPVLALFVLGIIAYLYLVFTKPENGILLICMQLPLLAEELLMFLITITVLSLLFKIIRGKRSISFNLCSGAALVMGIIFLSCTVFSFDSDGALQQAVPFLAAILLTVSVIMTVKSSTLADKCFRMLGISTLLCVLWGLNGTVMHLIAAEARLDTVIPTALQAFSGSFNTNAACSAFLIAMIPFFMVKHPSSNRIFSFPFLALVMLGLFLCNDYYAVAALLASILLSMFIFGKHRIFTAVAAIGIHIVTRYGIPAILNRDYSYNHITEFRSAKQLVDYFASRGFYGSGMGNEAVANACLEAGINASHIDKSFGVYTDLAMRFGIPLVIICSVLILVFISKNVSYVLAKYKSEAAKSKCAAIFTSVAAAGIYALYSDYIYDFRILAMLFLLLGLSSAIPDSADADFITSDIFLQHDIL